MLGLVVGMKVLPRTQVEDFHFCLSLLFEAPQQLLLLTLPRPSLQFLAHLKPQHFPCNCVALVLPNLDNKKIKYLENLIFNFLWENKPDKVCREDAKRCEKAGGLGIIDLISFWKFLIV